MVKVNKSLCLHGTLKKPGRNWVDFLKKKILFHPMIQDALHCFDSVVVYLPKIFRTKFEVSFMKPLLVIFPLFWFGISFTRINSTSFLTEQNLKLYCIDISMSMTGKKYQYISDFAITDMGFLRRREFYMRLIRDHPYITSAKGLGG